jgi:diguanylate cyclase (GGDEF)-like protein
MDGGEQMVGRESRVLYGYLAVTTLLLASTAVTSAKIGGATNLLIVLTGMTVLTVRVWTKRPHPLLGWALVAAASWGVMASAVTVIAVYGLRGDVTIDKTFPIVVSLLPFPVLIAGLVLLSRRTPYRGPADVLDAAMTALAAFLLGWAFFLDRAYAGNIPSVTVGVASPIAALLIFALAVRLILGGGFLDPALRWLLIGTFAFVGTMLGTLLPALGKASYPITPAIGVLWTVFGICLGAAGLHPALARETDRRNVASNDTSPQRLALFAVLALIPPFVWGVGLYRHQYDQQRGTTTIVVPVTTSAVFLLLLVVRLGLIARVSQQRARQLARRSTSLAQAVSEQEELQRQLAYRATHDPLTGLYNRVVLTERMAEALSRDGPRRNALLLLDLDQFKDINDTLGHPVGDELLVEVSRRLLRAMGDGATLARLGGDEFAVFLADTDPTNGLRWADTILTTVRRNYSIGGRELFLTTSIGVLITDGGQPNPTPSEALGDADLALYAAKEAGKNRVALFHPDLRSARLNHSRVSGGLRRALDQDEFLLHYQPVVDHSGQTVAFVEALLRWQVPGERLRHPAEFLSVAEDTGLILPIGAWVLRQACADVRSWYGEHRVPVSVNVSGRQLDDPNFAETVIATLTEAKLPGEALIIEITESSLLATSPSDARHEGLHRVREHGVRIAIDDFGTGYSSLSYLANLPVDLVKIDKSLTHAHGGARFPQDWAFTRAILQLVESLHMVAVAEGVETAEQAAALSALHCPLAQGYHFSRPVPAAAIGTTLHGQPASAATATRVATGAWRGGA